MLHTGDFLFIGLLAGQNDLDRAVASDTMPQVSAVKFQMSLLEGFEQHGVEFHILGALPVAAYPKSKTIFVKKTPFSTRYPKMSGVLMPDINLPIVRLAIRSITTFFYGAKLLVSGKGRNGIFIYPLHTPFLLAALCLKRLFRLPVYIFIPDLPMHTQGQRISGLLGAVKEVDNRLLKVLVSQVDCAFPITAKMAHQWLPASVRHLVVEGIAPRAQAKPQKPPRAVFGRRLLYTGQFAYVLNFARNFAARPEIDATLTFVGGGPDADELHALALKDPRFVIKTFVTGEAFEREFEDADFLLNPRDSTWKGGDFSFPSKLFDYMGRGRPILSTRIGGIPDEYFECFIPLDDSTADALMNSLNQAFSLSREDLLGRVAVGEALLSTTKSPGATAKRILEAL